MRTTASYELFPDAPSERAMARARYLVREGRVADAEKAYRDLLAEHPDLKPGWAECFELLRGQGRTEDALRFAEAARAQFGDSAFSLALKGAALIELARYRDALATLEQAVEFDPDLALVWHELGYAAFGSATEAAPCSRSTERLPWSLTPRHCGCAGGFSETPDATRPPKWRTRGPPRRPSTRSNAPRRSERSPPRGATLSTPRAGRTD